jgi:hypothetical protein
MGIVPTFLCEVEDFPKALEMGGWDFALHHLNTNPHGATDIVWPMD